MTMIFTEGGEHGRPVWGLGVCYKQGVGAEGSEFCFGPDMLTFHPAQDITLTDELKNYFFNNFLWVLSLALFCRH